VLNVERQVSVVGGIVIVGREVPRSSQDIIAHEDVHPVRVASPELTCVEVLGRSVVERTVDELKRVGVEVVTLLADASFVTVGHQVDRSLNDYTSTWMDQAWMEVSQTADQYKKNGMDWTFIVRVNAYVEIDFLGMLHFHRGHRQPTTQAWNEEGPLDIWVVDTAQITDGSISTVLREDAARYAVSGYVNRLEGAQDFRKLVADGLTGRCRLRPTGSEVRPGVWIEQGAQVHRRARLVGPVFIGRGSRIAEQCLITRCSNVESNCEIDYGTVIEDSSILADSYVGIGVDVAHSIIDGTMLLNLERDVQMEIADPGMIRKLKSSRKDLNRRPALGLVAMTGGASVPEQSGIR